MLVKSLFSSFFLMATSVACAQYYKATDRSIAVMGSSYENKLADNENVWEEENLF